MGVPKKRTSRQKRDQRRAHWKVTPPNVIRCAKCQSPVLSHHVCKNCGHYNGREVMAGKE